MDFYEAVTSGLGDKGPRKLTRAAAGSANLRGADDSLDSTRAVVLAGGRGTRLAPYTSVLPKPLMPIGEQAILEIVVEQLEAYRRVTRQVGLSLD